MEIKRSIKLVTLREYGPKSLRAVQLFELLKITCNTNTDTISF